MVKKMMNILNVRVAAKNIVNVNLIPRFIMLVLI